MIDYFFHRFNPEKFRLVMTILVKNESDIIAQNIKTHQALGVDAFVVMDNDSNDGTREMLEDLKKEYEITVIDEKGAYNQKKWMTRLAKEAKSIYKADWVINNDADEFWIPHQGGLKESLRFKGGVVWVARSNMLMQKEDTSWEDARFQVHNHVKYRYGTPNELLGVIGRKTIVNPHGLFQINSGNHSAEHIAVHKKREIESLHIYHYPYRGYAQFERNIQNRAVLLDKNPLIKMGKHYKRWVEMYKKGKLEEAYQAFIFSNDEIETLKKCTILRENLLPSQTIIRN